MAKFGTKLMGNCRLKSASWFKKVFYITMPFYRLLFIPIVSFAVGDVEPSVFHMVDETVFCVDPAAVFVLQIIG